jgi:hypothetical protein
MLTWVIVIVAVWWISKYHYQNQADNTPLSVEFVPIKNDITEEHAMEAQMKFENRIKDVCLPDAISGKEIYIYKNLMSVWYAKLSAENRYNPAVIQKLRGDWIEYMNALRDKSAFNYLASESTEKEKGDAYQDRHMVASKKVSTIEEAFASLVGNEATEELSRIRLLADHVSFSKEGELIPEGFEVGVDGKIQLKKQKMTNIFLNKLFQKKTKV